MTMRAWIGATLLLASCTGAIGDPSGPGGASGPGSGANPMLGGQILDPGPAVARRLTSAEYGRSVAYLLAHPDGQARPAVVLPPDLGGPADSGFTFDNYAPTNTVSTAPHADAYRRSAKAWVAALFAAGQEARRAAVIGCDLAGAGATSRAACLTQLITTFGRRAFRRPLSDAEVGGYTILAEAAAADPDRWKAAALVLEAMLQSPAFLFRIEEGVPEPERPGQVRLTGYEVAARLSFLLWGMTPTEELLDAAAAGALDTQTGVGAQAERLLAADSGRARSAFSTFSSQLLQVHRVVMSERDPVKFPLWSDGLVQDMAEETRRVLDDAAFTPGVDFRSFLTTRQTFLTRELARLYGLPEPAQPWARVDLPPERVGVFTLAAVLTATAHDGNDPIHRGAIITRQLLCTVFAPPKVVPDPPAEGPPRIRFAQHRSDPACGGCHVHLDGVGIAFERFDEIGRYRTKADFGDQYIGYPLDNRAEYPGFVPTQFTDVELGQRLVDSPELAPCLVRQTFRYSLGRLEVSSDEPTLGRIETAFRASGHAYEKLMVALVESDAFRFRRAAVSESGGAP